MVTWKNSPSVLSEHGLVLSRHIGTPPRVNLDVIELEQLGLGVQQKVTEGTEVGG